MNEWAIIDGLARLGGVGGFAALGVMLTGRLQARAAAKATESQQLIDGWKGLSVAEAESWQRRFTNLEAELAEARDHQARCEAEVAELKARIVELERIVERRQVPREGTGA